MKMKIVADSSANLLALPDIDFGIVPLHVIVGENDYVDDDKIDLTAMQKDLSSYKGKTSTSSPIITLEVGFSIVTLASTPFAEPEPMSEDLLTPLD